MRPNLARRLAGRADRLASVAAFAAASQIVAHRHGIAPERLRQGLSVSEATRCAHAGRGLADNSERDLARARHEAIYLAVTVFGRQQRSIARAAGCSHKTVQKACAAVEERREDGGFDRDLDEIEIQLMGSPA